MATDVFGIVGTLQAGVFQVESVVAEGGFGVVYRAQHVAFRAPVALKCLKVPELMTVADRAIFLDKFREEGELLFRLSASIPAVLRPLHVDALLLEGARLVPFLALEWLDGEALDQIIRRRAAAGRPPIALEKLVRLLAPIAGALSRAHRFEGTGGPSSIIHRDLKPENIFVADVGGVVTVKILDFGIARTKSAATLHAGRVTTEAVVAFTPAYAAPEQWLPKRFGQTGPWTDVWGLALTMVAALTGRQPIDGDVPAMMGTTIDESRRPTPRAEGATVSDEIEAIFTRALAVDPRRRTQTIEELWTELEAALGLPLTLGPQGDGARFTESSMRPPAMSDAERGEAPTEMAPPNLRAPPLPKPSNPGIEERASKPSNPGSNERPSKPSNPGSNERPSKPSSPGSRNPLPEPKEPDRFEIPIEVASQRRPIAPRTMATQDQTAVFGLQLRERLRTPAWLMLIGSVIAVADIAHTRLVGEAFTLGGVRTSWLTGPLVVAGLLLALWRFVSAAEE